MISSVDVVRYVGALRTGDSAAGEEIVRSLVRGGAGAGAIVDELIGPAQTRIGELWESDQISVSDEHIATAMSMRLVRLANELAPPRARIDARVMVVSSPGEWHRLAVDMICELTDTSGGHVIAPPSTASAGQLIPVVHDEGPELIALSCAMPANLARAHAVVSVAREAHVPIIVGGRAFTLSPARAEVFGVALAPTVGNLLERMSELDAWIPPAVADDAARRIGVIEPRVPNICDHMVAAVRTLRAAGDPIADALWAVRALSSAVVCADPSILVDQLTWQQHRHERVGALSAGEIASALAAAVADEAPSQLATVEAAVAALRTRAGPAQSS